MIHEIKNLSKQTYENYTSPTPKWARHIRNAGIIAGALGGGILAAPALFPAAVVSIGGYLVFGGSVATAIFQGFKTK